MTNPRPTTPDASTVASVLDSAQHRAGLNDLTLVVSAVTQRYSWLARVTGKIPGMANTDPEVWTHPNLAVRMAVPDPDDALGPMVGQPGLCRRVYTLAEVDMASETVAIDIVVHGTTSPMMRWLAGLAPGDTVDFAGPRPHPAPTAPNDGTSIYLLADGSSYPAASAIARSLPAGAVATVVLHLPEGGSATTAADATTYAEDFPGATTLVITRNSATPLADALEEIQVSDKDLVWAAGEREDIRAVRSQCLGRIGLPKSQMQVFGYWRRGKTGTDTDLARLQGVAEMQRQGRTLSADNDFEIDI